MTKQIVVFAFLLIVLFSYKVSAQTSQENYFDNQGRPFTKKTSEIEGDPYLFDKWLPGKVQAANDKTYDGFKLKYDIADDLLVFAYDSADEPLKFVDDIKTFTIILPEPIVFTNGFPSIDKQTSQSYYQLISNGKTKLLKRRTKVVLESKGYNTVVKKYQEYNNYYIFKDNKIAKLENPKKTLYALAGAKKTDIDNYLKSNSINFKRDEDLARLFDYYNTLAQ
ncbi:hypothetical protein ACFQ3S_17090 [Mucilaginibacter terrae]|uniref:hypothetical protein n=1 Tax=Mucilaginibacter terrae TaxID=1955052 RepID=UPI00363DADFB